MITRVFEINTEFEKLKDSGKVHPDRDFVNNRVMTTRYNSWNFVPKNLFEQVFTKLVNTYFLFLIVLQLVPGIG